MNRALDVAIAGTGLVIGSPFLAAGALAVKLQDGGPVLYRQTRVGKDGEDFELLKLRTMVVNAEKQGAGFAVDKGDSRITRAGRLLRRLSIDELPQLWNVVRGEMSVIGPRPTLRYQVDHYDERQLHRLDVKPGITGWAQIHGRASLPWADRIELDLWYVKHHDWKTDLLILVRTPLALFGGTYAKGGGWRPPRLALCSGFLLRPVRSAGRSSSSGWPARWPRGSRFGSVCAQAARWRLPRVSASSSPPRAAPYVAWRFGEDLRVTTRMHGYDDTAAGPVQAYLPGYLVDGAVRYIPQGATFATAVGSGIPWTAARAAFPSLALNTLFPRVSVADPRRADYVVTWGIQPGRVAPVSRVWVARPKVGAYDAVYVGKVER